DVDQIRTLQLGRQRPDDFDALDLHQQGDRLYADLRLAALHDLSDVNRALSAAGRDEPRLWLEFDGDTQLFDDLLLGGEAGLRVGISDRFDAEKGFLERFNGADIRFGAALLDRHTELSMR